MKPFEYVEPVSVEEAVAALARGGRAIAGGTDILVRLKRGGSVERLVGLRRIATLLGISRDAEGTRIGALVSLDELGRSEIVAQDCPVLAEAAIQMASPQVRVLATIGGNLCNASPAADLAPPLLCLGARLHVAGPKGARRIPIGEFFTGPGRCVLEPGELLVSVHVPPLRGRGAFLKFSPRRAMDLAVVSAAAVKSDGEVRLALGAVAPTPLLVPPSHEEAARRCSPIDDVRASAEYRRHLVRVLARRVLEKVS